MAAINEPEAYLRSGSNELKILEYKIGQLHMGINILKVSRILERPIGMNRSRGRSGGAVLGLFEDHGHIVPIVDLGEILGMENTDEGNRVIITEFFDEVTGFLVDAVEKVHTLSWKQIISADDIMVDLDNPYVLSVVRPEGRENILMMDYEKIVLELAPDLGVRSSSPETEAPWNGEGRRILVTEDSTPVREMLKMELEEIGFQVTVTRDGEEAETAFNADPEIALVIADVEMPKMDGLALLGRIRRHPERSGTPVLIYSSIGDIGMKERAKVMAANGHITKLDMDTLFENIRRIFK